MEIFALVDCNNFYASCERAFNPSLERQPIIILSNNDGCVISRSNEAKALGVPMGAPYFQWRYFCRHKKIRVFSSNYELYGDMSQRVMAILGAYCPEIEIYSIDEAFLALDSFKHFDLIPFAQALQLRIKKGTGIPVSIGIGPTKTLAKIANYLAKKHSNGVYTLLDEKVRDEVLATFPVENIWGVGKQLTKRLHRLEIYTAQQLRDADLKNFRRLFSVVVEKIIRELRGVSCLPLEDVQPKKQIMSSKSFGKTIYDQENVAEALSCYTARACEKLRLQKSRAGGIQIFLQTNSFGGKARQYGRSISLAFVSSTQDTCVIVAAAKMCLEKIFKKGYGYQKVGICLLELTPEARQQFDLITSCLQPQREKMMGVLDSINQRWGKRALFVAAEGVKHEWRRREEYRSPRASTRWKEMVVVK
jgi:DNA polymerase V